MKITFFKNEWETYIPQELMCEMQWDQIAELLTSFITVQNKEDTEMYNLWEFKVNEEGLIHRCKDDCVALHGLVLDYDQNLNLEQALEQFDGFECVIYTTFNHGKDSLDKFRIVVPFTHPMPVEEFNKKRESMIEAFPGVDRASFSRSQAIFLHSGPSMEQAFAARLTGSYLDWTVFTDEEIIPYTVSTRKDSSLDPEFAQSYRTEVINSLLTCRGIRHLNSLNLAIILKSCGATFNDYCAIVKVAGASDSCIQDKKSQQETWAAVPDDVRIGKVKRDEYIRKFGGTPPYAELTSRTNIKKAFSGYASAKLFKGL